MATECIVRQDGAAGAVAAAVAVGVVGQALGEEQVYAVSRVRRAWD